MTKRERKSQLKHYHQDLTVQDTAKILQVCTHTVYRMIHKRILPSIKIGGVHHISKEHIINFLQSGDPLCSNPKEAMYKKH